MFKIADMEKFLYNIDKVGNTSAASIPILLDETYKNNKLNKGDNILFCSFGAGMSLGMVLFKWTLENKINPNKVALVTGGAKGIGKSIAIKLKNKGYKTIICSRNNIISSDIHYDIDSYKIDISNHNDVKKLRDIIICRYG